MDQSPSNHQGSLARWTLCLFIVTITLLVGSVVLPAVESERVLGLLDDDEHLVEPLRLLTSQLVSGVAEESAQLQRYAVAGDAAALANYREAAAHDDRIAEAMQRIADELNGDLAGDAASVGRLLERWHSLAANDTRDHPSPANAVAVVDRREVVRDSVMLATASLDAGLAEWSARRRDAVATHEQRGVVVNAALVLIALAALAAVFEVMRRERRHARREAALRLAAERLASKFAVSDVDQQVAHGAAELLLADGVLVVHAESRAGQIQLAVAARAGSAVALTEEIDPRYQRSIIERILDDGSPKITPAAGLVGQHALTGRAIVIPLGASDAPVGAVIALEAPGRRFHRDDLPWADIFAHLASLSYERVRLLEEAQAGRARLERAMESRGRLIRGFSHDVKNPLGAADGYAALLQDGVYGPVSNEQRSSIARVRDALHRALTLIDDLHELARAETGHLDIRLEATDLGALMIVAGEEYRAAAEAKHLGFVVDVEARLPRVETDPSRVRQVVGNLLSNAIKYTDAGSIALRVRLDSPVQADESARALIEVEDTGPGIPHDKQTLIFDEFARLATGRASGAGLGLAISKHVADALGCRLEVLSEVGHGATFTLCIPVRSEITQHRRRTDLLVTVHPPTDAPASHGSSDIRTS